MSRPLTSSLRHAIFSHFTNQVLLPIITIDHAEIEETLRFVRNTEGILSGGHDYVPLGFDISLPEDMDDGTVKSTKLTIDAVDQSVIAAVRALDPQSGPLLVTLSIVLAETPDVVEIGPLSFKSRSFQYDGLTATLDLSYEDRLNNVLTALSFTPNDFPGLF